MVSGRTGRHHFGVVGDGSYEGIVFYFMVVAQASLHHFGVLTFAFTGVVMMGLGGAHGKKGVSDNKKNKQVINGWIVGFCWVLSCAYGTIPYHAIL